MYYVRTQHQIVSFGPDNMQLFDVETMSVLVNAVRSGDTWTVHADGVDDGTANTRADAINEMVEHARKASPGYPNNGFSTFVPRGLADLP